MERDDFTTPCRVCGARGDTSVCSERCLEILEAQQARERAEFREQRRHERLTGERGREGKY